MSTAPLRIEQARWWALINEPFYASLAMSLGDVIDPAIETASTNGKVIRWNPDYVETLTDEEVRFVLLHETLHCAHQHLWRLPADDKGNEAGDHEINLTLAALDGLKMPEGGLADPQYEGLSCEEIYGRLPDEPPGGGGGGEQPQPGDQSSGSGRAGQPDSGQQPGGVSKSGHKPDPCGTFSSPATDPAAPDPGSEKLRDDWESRVIQANQATQALGAGDVPADMERLLERMRHQAVDWRREMADFVKDAMSTRNDWTRSAKRYAWQPVIYPRRRADDIGTVVFARDTSGSVSNTVAAQYSALITDCVAEMNCAGLILDCDRSIQAEYIITAGEECPLRAKGGGGTSFNPVFDRVAEMVARGEQIAGIVYLTDLQPSNGRFPEPPDVATLWLATADKQAPFGRTVRVEMTS
jgi:predicted metal-dependent peptidase